MLMQVHRHILTNRIERLKQHLENVGGGAKFEDALDQAEEELEALDAQREEQPQKS